MSAVANVSTYIRLKSRRIRNASPNLGEMDANLAVEALEIGLHHDGKVFNGNPLETQMRRRIFWCVFMLRM